jgi:hypothetical protein
MLDRFDDYLIHQTTDPVSHPVSGDRNHYDRYFFHGYDRDANFFFCACWALYPNRRIMDAHFSSQVADNYSAPHFPFHLGQKADPKPREEGRVGEFQADHSSLGRA